MKKQLALAVVLGLFLISIVNPAPSLMPLAIGNELNEKPFFAAGDGSQSSDSIYSFGETLPDDTLYYPDAFAEVITEVAYTGSGLGTIHGTYADTHADGGNAYEADASASACYLTLSFNMTTTEDMENITGISVNLDFRIYSPVSANEWLYGYNYTSSAYVVIASPFSSGWQTYNWTTTDSDYWSSGNIVTIKLQASTGAGSVYTDIDQADCEYTVNYLYGSSSGYGESFVDISDWVEGSFSGADATSTGGDIATFTTAHDAGSVNDYWYSNTPSITVSGSYYAELRFKITTTLLSLNLYWRVFTADDRGGSVQNSPSRLESVALVVDTWYTYKFLITLASVECVGFHSRTYADTRGLVVDYLRIGDSTELGFQHDGSTTEGTTTADGSGFSTTITSDGDKLNITMTKASGTGTYNNAYIWYDTTATKANLERDYYPFYAVAWEVTLHTVTYGALKICPFIDGYRRSDYGENLVSSGATGSGIERDNTKPYSTATADGKIMLSWTMGAADTGSIIVLIDWAKVYSIAEWSYTDSGATSNDYLYTSSNVLYGVVDSGYIQLNDDPALSVSDTYSVWNLTTGDSPPEFRHYAGGHSAWSSGETRGATISGTITGCNVKFESDGWLSEIIFIEDGTAPDILDKFIDPGEPYDDETVTIMTVAYDGQEVYKCTINAVVCPAAFSDVDYEMTETDQEHVFTYAFSTLAAGYYLFQIQVSDGANTYEEYISVRVREAEILITTYTFFGASSDFSYMQFSGYISRDCTYNISEWSDSWAKNETHTGSVTEGMFNIAWDKIGVDDIEANFTIVFVNGSLSKTVPGYYGTAYKELSITEIKVHNPEESQAITNITVNFYTNKDIDWFVYDVDDSDAVLASGSSVEGSDVLRWLKDRTPFIHNYAIKWTDGVSNIWFNSSYWTYKENIDSIDQPGKDWDAIDRRKTIEFWTTLGAFVAIGGIIAIGISHYKLNKKIGNLPNYKTQ